MPPRSIRSSSRAARRIASATDRSKQEAIPAAAACDPSVEPNPHRGDTVVDGVVGRQVDAEIAIVILDLVIEVILDLKVEADDEKILLELARDLGSDATRACR